MDAEPMTGTGKVGAGAGARVEFNFGWVRFKLLQDVQAEMLSRHLDM